MREPTKQAKLEAIEALSGGAQPIFNTSCGTCVDCGPYRWRRRGEIVQPKDCEFSGRYDHNTIASSVLCFGWSAPIVLVS